MRISNPGRTVWVLVASAVVLAACGGSGGDDGGLVAPPPVPATPQITTAPTYTALPGFNNPISMKRAPGDTTRWFVAEKSGVIRVFADNPASSSTSGGA